MRIGLIAPPWVPVPPHSYGGTEVVVDNLARGLAELGHDVRLFTVGESTCPVERGFLYPAAVTPMGTAVEEAAHTLAAYESLTDVDVIHDHTVLGPLLAAVSAPNRPPVVCTYHGEFTPDTRRIFTLIAQHAAVTAISHKQQELAGSVPIFAVVHHGIDLDAYRPGSGDGGHLIFIGRMSPDKGVDRAIRVARATGHRLVIISKMREDIEHEYFEDEVEPLLGPDIDLLIEPPPEIRMDLLGRAAAFLNPICWPEPFGLVMAESLAMGTPVLAFPNGAAPEIVDHGRSGFLCQDEDDMASAVRTLSSIDRRACRAAAERRFSMQRMARDYVAVYQRLLDPGPALRRHSGAVVTGPAYRSTHPAPARMGRE